MAHYVLSDIHGEADRFHAKLEKIGFSDDDTLLGDVVDRGPDGIALLREIMDMPNAVMLLGNHEYMMLQYLSPEATETEIRRWNRNGNGPTLAAFRALQGGGQRQILDFLRARPTHLRMEACGQNFWLVHGFPGANAHDEVWGRPGPETPSPVPDCVTVIGHTPVLCLSRSDWEQDTCVRELERRG